MAIPAWIASLFDPVAKVIDELHTSKEEKAQAHLALVMAQTQIVTNIMEYESRVAEMKRDVIIAEAQGQSWLQRNWRPMIMCVFGTVVAWNYIIGPLGSWISLMFDGPAFPLLDMTTGFWTLLTTGIGGYIVTRSGEKIASTVSQNRPS